jgi:hypothetical protein
MASIDQTIAKIRSFQSLPKGWYYGDGDAIGYDMREKAILFVRIAEENGVSRADAFPNVDGQVGVSFYIGRKTLAIILELDGTYNVIEDIQNTIVSDLYEISETEAKLRLWEFSQGNRIMSVSSTLNIGSVSAIDSTRLLLSVLQNQRKTPTEEFRSSQQSASEVQINPFASISDTTILQVL